MKVFLQGNLLNCHLSHSSWCSVFTRNLCPSLSFELWFIVIPHFRLCHLGSNQHSTPPIFKENVQALVVQRGSHKSAPSTFSARPVARNTNDVGPDQLCRNCKHPSPPQPPHYSRPLSFTFGCPYASSRWEKLCQRVALVSVRSQYVF